MHVSRKFLVLTGLLFLVAYGVAKASDDQIDYEVLRYRAKVLAASPYEAPKTKVPTWLLAPNFTYAEHRDIRFKPDHAWWLREGLPFQLQFFHPGFIYDKTVQIYELRGKRASAIPFSRNDFDYGKTKLKGEIPANMGFSGFRIHYPLNNPNYMDELAVFQGASYFRALCTHAVYGLSARGIAVDTVD